MTLLVGRDGDEWVSAVGQARADVPITALAVGRELTDETGELGHGYRLGASGAVLVRPDGYVAWRRETVPDDPVGAVTSAIDVSLGRTATAPCR